jgi:hypothetical protein
MTGETLKEYASHNNSSLTHLAATVERSQPGISRIIPGDWGKVGSGWLARPLSSRVARLGSGGRIHQFLWRRSRAVSNAKRNLAARNDEKPFQAVSSNPSWFRVWANRSYPEGIRLLLCISTDGRLWRSSQEGQPNERRRKAGQSERSNREGHGISAGSVKTFRTAGDVKNAPLACERKAT